MRSRSILSFCLVVASIAVLSGCDDRPKRAAISGTVLIDGEPLESGVIQFTPNGTRPSYGQIVDGKYTMRCFEEDDGVILGSHAVSVNASEIVSSSKIRWFAPKKYSDPRTSGINLNIEEANENLVIELTWDGGKPYVEDSGRSSFEETSDDI